MELTLSVTQSPALSVETLIAFVKKATHKGKDASTVLAELIASDVSSTRRPAKKKGAKAA